MSRFLSAAAVLMALTLFSGSASAGKIGLGREATPAEIAAWDIDIRPDGKGLPKGRGSVARGERIFLVKCAACHGEFGEGTGRWPILAGGHDTLDSDDPVRTIGSYWPYLSSVFDYIRRAMPFGDARSLTADETYAITAYLLQMNDIVEEDFVLSEKNFRSIHLPNEKNFVTDPRPDTPLASKQLPRQHPCMKECKKSVKITGRARILNVTPEKDKDRKQ